MVMLFRLIHNYSFSNSLLLQNPETVLKMFSGLNFELCSYPPTLFSSAQFLRDTHKPVLADAIWSFLPDQGIPGLPRKLQYVLDGGHCFSAFHGQMELLSGRYALCTRSMSQGSMKML